MTYIFILFVVIVIIYNMTRKGGKGRVRIPNGTWVRLFRDILKLLGL